MFPFPYQKHLDITAIRQEFPVFEQGSKRKAADLF